MASTIIIPTLTPPFSQSWHKIQSRWRLPGFTLSTMGTKELVASPQFHLWMT